MSWKAASDVDVTGRLECLGREDNIRGRRRNL